MRHAKSDWSAPAAGDHERPLAPRGIKAARLMGRFLTACKQQPNLVLTSTAVRARTTVELAADAGEWPCEIATTKAFYGTDAEAVLHELVTNPNLPQRLLVAGHEPTWSSLVALLIGGGSVRMPTAAVACVELNEVPWSGLVPGCGELRWQVTPKLVGGVL
jgi:phosphohistidine phosphatase